MDLISKKISEVFTIPFDEGGDTYEKVVFYLSDSYLIFEIDINYDELIIKILETHEISAQYHNPVWSKELIGKKIIGFWKAENQNGYLDLFALGLDEFVPSVIISCIASHIEVGLVNYKL